MYSSVCFNLARMPRALITGITGQDGSYLAELLLGKGYEVHGVVRRSSSFNTGRIDHLYEDPHAPERHLILHYGDLNDASSLNRLLRVVRPDEIYNLGAQTHVRVSFDTPDYTSEVTGLGCLRLLEAVRELQIRPRIYQASSSEMYGSAPPPQNEETPFQPRSPYAIAKLYSHWMTVNYREAYGLFAVSGILFNHESPRRGETFVSRKVTRAVGRIQHGLQDRVYLGNLNARRDWGFARDYVEAMWLMLQQPVGDDYVVATGEPHSIRDLVDVAFDHIGIDDWTPYVRQDKAFMRPAEVDRLVGDATKAREVLGWRPRVGFEELVRLMFDADIDAQKAGW